jgi:hypothetical protein
MFSFDASHPASQAEMRATDAAIGSLAASVCSAQAP